MEQTNCAEIILYKFLRKSLAKSRKMDKVKLEYIIITDWSSNEIIFGAFPNLIDVVNNTFSLKFFKSLRQNASLKL